MDTEGMRGGEKAGIEPRKKKRGNRLRLVFLPYYCNLRGRE